MHRDGEGKILIIEDKKEAVGYLFYEWDGTIDFLAVDESYRGRGLARKLLEGALRELKEQGVKEASLTVNHLDKTTIEFYKHLGFKERERNVSFIIER